MIEERQVDGFSALTLADPAAGELDATFVPEAGMVACSLRHRGEELLGQRGGLRKYVEERMTMGIPLLHPWANRVALRRFEVAGREVDLDRVPERLRHDSNGLPMHGLLSGIGGWRVRDAEEGASGAVLAAAFDFDAGEGLTGAFPFPHQVLVEARLSVDTLTISTTVLASRDSRVPIAFGYHPYLRLPEIERAGWEIEVPVSERLALDDHGLPTGAREPTAAIDGPLGARTFDDLYVAPEPGAPLALAGGGRRLEVRFLKGYPYAQVYAPADDDVVALEPMTAQTNALVAGGPDLTVIEPGASYEGAFSITVTADG